MEKVQSTKDKGQKRVASNLPNFPQLEEDVLARWKQRGIFQKTLEKTKGGKRFVFFEGPPTANGMPHIGHVETRAFKDIIPRFKTMQGFFVERKAGWDTQGLPVELEIEKQLGISGKKQIEEYGVVKFNAEAKKSVWKYKDLWEKMSERVGFWLDFEHPYITYSNEYIESLWWIFKQIWDQKLLEQDFKVVPYCPRCETALSSHEVAQGYKEVKEPSVYVKFKLKKGQKIGDWTTTDSTFILAWTTTPWTLPGNVALAVGEDIEYCEVTTSEKESLILATAALEKVGIQGSVAKPGWNGSDLKGLQYEPLFDFVDLAKESGKKAYYVATADFVSTSDGTGVVHTAVMYGEDDFQLGKKLDLPTIHTVDLTGRFNGLVTPWVGKEVKDEKGETQKEVIHYLHEKGSLLKVEDYTHDYPFCWRCKHPLLYYAKNSWFIRMSTLRNELLANNEQINWKPEHIKEGRFGEWLREVKDWAVSRERYWGTPLPIWVCSNADCKHEECFGSYKELFAALGKEVPNDFDPHRPFVDALTFPCTECDSGTMQRVPEVADAWFDSGSMPYAQWHYPFENQERVDKEQSFPADFISEAIDQTRGWFYTLLAIGTILQKSGVVKESPFKNVVVLGHLNDAQGRKLSKSLGNYGDPMELINTLGADAIRFFLYSTNAPWETKNFDPKVVQDIVRKNFLILWNVINFWEMSGGTETAVTTDRSDHVLDQWICALLDSTIQGVTEDLESYRITEASRKLSSFINDLSTWYVRRSRDRVKIEGDDKRAMLATLGHVIKTLSLLMAPFTPFVAEMVYERIRVDKESVHLEDWPKVGYVDTALLDMMQLARQSVELGHSLREEAGMKVRQPLPQLVIAGAKLDKNILDVVADEVNVRDVICAEKLPTGTEWKTKSAGTLSVALDSTLTDELLYEGWVREMIRAINDLRKKAGLTPADRVRVVFSAEDATLGGVLEQYAQQIADGTRADSVHNVQSVDTEQRKIVQLGEHNVTVGIQV